MSVLDDPRLNGFRKGYEAGRIEAIEQCARVVESYHEDDYTPPVVIDRIAAHLRGLKEVD